jgi:hypothetical protein
MGGARAGLGRAAQALIVTAWWAAFALGQLVEAPIYFAALRQRPWVLRLLIALGPNAITHPVVWWLFPRWLPDSYLAMAVFAEAFAVIVEAAYLWLFSVRRALVWSLASNAASLAVGLGVRALVGWP